MQNPRKTIILNEILYWKKNNLLPAHYCDFLATLYAEGDDLDSPSSNVNANHALLAQQQKPTYLMVGLLYVGSLFLLALLFTISTLTIPLLAIGVVVLGVLFFIAYKVRANRTIRTTLLHMLISLLLLGLSVKLSVLLFPGHEFVLYTVLVVNCLIWLAFGLVKKAHYFTISGLVALGFMIFYKFVL